MPISDNKPTVFDTLINEVRQNVESILEAVRTDFNGPEAGEGEPVAEEPSAPVAPEKEIDELSVEGLSLVAIRILKKAENTDYVDEAEQLIRIADRYIRLTELAIHANINL